MKIPGFLPIPLEDLLIPETPIIEHVIRGVVIYFALMPAFRLIGKRESAQLTSFDLILLLIVAEAISPAINADDTSITAGMIVTTTLFAVNYLMAGPSSGAEPSRDSFRMRQKCVSATASTTSGS